MTSLIRPQIPGPVLADQLLDGRVFGAPELLRRHHPESQKEALAYLMNLGHETFVREICREAVMHDRTFHADVPHLIRGADPTDLAQWQAQAHYSRPSHARKEVVAITSLLQGRGDLARHFWSDEPISRTHRVYRGMRSLYWAELSGPPGEVEAPVIRWLMANREPVSPIAQGIASHPDPARQAAWVAAVMDVRHPQLMQALAVESRRAAAANAANHSASPNKTAVLASGPTPALTP